MLYRHLVTPRGGELIRPILILNYSTWFLGILGSTWGIRQTASRTV